MNVSTRVLSTVTLTVVLSILIPAFAGSLESSPGNNNGGNSPPAKRKGDADGRNDMFGKARWEWRLLNQKEKVLQTGTFTGYINDKSIRTGKNQVTIGTYSKSEDYVNINFKQGPLIGEVKLIMVRRKPLKYRGELVRSTSVKNGFEGKNYLVVEIIND